MVRKQPRPEVLPLSAPGTHMGDDQYKSGWSLNAGSACRCSYFSVPVSLVSHLPVLSHLLFCAPISPVPHLCCAHSPLFLVCPYFFTPLSPIQESYPHLWPLHGKHPNPPKPEWGGGVPSHVALAQNLYVPTFQFSPIDRPHS